MSDFHGYQRYFQFGWRHRLEVVHDHLILDGVEYMERWLFRTKFFHIRLHKITASDDPDRPFHDHPMDFISLILTGGYRELSPGNPPKDYGPGSFNVCRAEDAHCLLLKKDGVPVPRGEVDTTWTLVLTGPIRRDWGFLTEQGWLGHEEYLAWQRSM